MWKIFSVPCGSALCKFHCILYLNPELIIKKLSMYREDLNFVDRFCASRIPVHAGLYWTITFGMKGRCQVGDRLTVLCFRTSSVWEFVYELSVAGGSYQRH
jgi:hypothetical protein